MTSLHSISSISLKVVMKGMSKAEYILKVVLSPLDPADAFVTNLLRLLPETDLSEFQKILEMKNVRRHDQAALIEAFKNKAGPQVSSRMSGHLGCSMDLLDDSDSLLSNLQ